MFDFLLYVKNYTHLVQKNRKQKTKQQLDCLVSMI